MVKKFLIMIIGICGLICTPIIFPLGHYFHDIELEEDWKAYRSALIQMIFNYDTIAGEWCN